jgi:hypothetical protein
MYLMLRGALTILAMGWLFLPGSETQRLLGRRLVPGNESDQRPFYRRRNSAQIRKKLDRRHPAESS